MIEYALMAGLAAASAGFALPQIALSFAPIYADVTTNLALAGGASADSTPSAPATPPPSGGDTGHGDHGDH